MTEMMTTGKVDVAFDRAWFDGEYDFWALRTGRSHLSYDSRAFDLPSNDDAEVLAAAYDGSRTCYLMVSKGAYSRFDMAALMRGCGDPSLTCDTAPAAAIGDDVLLQLLINSTAKGPYDDERWSNLSGRLLVPMPWRFKRDGGKLTRYTALRVAVESDMSLRLSVATYTSLACDFPKTRGSRKLRPVTELPRYRVTRDGRLVRDVRLGKDDPRAFVNRSVGKRNEGADYLGLLTTSFRKSKIGILYGVLGKLQRRYGAHMSLVKSEIPASVHIALPKPDRGRWLEHMASRAGLDAVGVEDTVGTPVSRAVLSDVRRRIAQDWGLRACAVTDSAAFDGPLISLVREADWYRENGGDDPYRHAPAGVPVQHMTLESARSDSDLDLAMSNLMVKSDICRGRLSTVDWNGFGLDGRWRFAFAVRDGGDRTPPAIAEMSLDGKGGLSFSLDRGGFPSLGSDGLALVAREHPGSLIVQGGAGDINLIDRTESFSIPEVMRIGRYFEGVMLEGERAQRTLPKGLHHPEGPGPSSFDYRLREVADITGAVVDDRHALYRVGLAAGSIGKSVPRAPILRCVTAVEGRLLLDEICRMCDVGFVRLRRATVVPFPFKYLREWVAVSYPEMGPA